MFFHWILQTLVVIRWVDENGDFRDDHEWRWLANIIHEVPDFDEACSRFNERINGELLETFLA